VSYGGKICQQYIRMEYIAMQEESQSAFTIPSVKALGSEHNVLKLAGYPRGGFIQ